MIGSEAREQILEAEGRLPEVAIACVGGGSNAIGLFSGFMDDDVRLVGVEAEGAASLVNGRPGVLHGARSSLLADEDGQVLDAHSISRRGSTIPGVGPEHAFLRDSGRAEYVSGGRRRSARRVSPARAAPRGSSPRSSPRTRSRARAKLDDELILVCLSGRGDKDLAEVVGL